MLLCAAATWTLFVFSHGNCQDDCQPWEEKTLNFHLQKVSQSPERAGERPHVAPTAPESHTTGLVGPIRAQEAYLYTKLLARLSESSYRGAPFLGPLQCHPHSNVTCFAGEQGLSLAATTLPPTSSQKASTLVLVICDTCFFCFTMGPNAPELATNAELVGSGTEELGKCSPRRQ